VGGRLQGGEGGLLLPRLVLHAVRRRQQLVGEELLLRGPSRAWSRCFSISAASSISDGTDGRNTDAVSPGLRARTKRPTACAKNSGVCVEVA
jgi:hypothetical protein